MQVMVGPRGWVQSVTFSPDGMLIASGSYDREVRILDAATGLQVGVYTGHSGHALHVAFSADGRHVASGGSGGHVHVWSTEAPHRSVKDIRDCGWVTSLIWISSTRLVIASSNSVTVCEVDSDNPVEKHYLGEIVAFAVTADGKLAASSTREGLTVWDA